MPGSLDEYYQEIGRAGRDGQLATAICFYRPADLGLQQFFTGARPDPQLRSGAARQPGGAAASGPPPAAAAQAAVQFAVRYRSVQRSRIGMMRRYAELTNCRRRFLLRYFGEAVADPCGRCDNCDAGLSTADQDGQTFGPVARIEHRT